ncbi:putative exo-beta- -glucanase [Rosellinia necatrix]|uniref:Putative exo-beta--glucanase n=1 Tax=Rosellinia necatrix TaxID=77044 RepID=A0A1S8A8Y6_ROSNE|nr:putative exo-beta- -glucanase [Rosellinia necatrix]
MVDNTNNNHGVAPIKGKYNGPVWAYSGSFQNYMDKLHEKKASGLLSNSTTTDSNGLNSKRASSYWLPQLAAKGKAPLAGNGYVFYRNVMDYGADNTGATDTVEAINAAIEDGDRCGEECGNTFVQGAVVYFPPGEYKICTPIIQLYYTQFISDPGDRAIIKGCDKFTGIALIDVDPYVPNQAQPDGTGVNWYVNQNQFFRQIRNFVFDLTEMPSATDEHGQKLVPTGLHWQVSQATSLQNLLFKMPTTAKSGGNVTHVGIFTENGSGGFVSDLEFEGGAIGWRVGSQQYTAIGLKFTNCVTAVQMIWDWGFNWQRIEINGGTVAFNISGKGGIDKQGIGSISVIDSTINNTPIGILTNADNTTAPNIVIDNTQFTNVGAIVQATTGDVLLAGGSKTVDLWATGLRYGGGDGNRQTGAVEKRPSMSSRMLDGGKLFTRSRPQYEDMGVGSFLIATEHGCSNDGTGDNTDAINSFLKQAAGSGMIAYFPAGIYTIEGTVTVPAGSKLQGTSWSQIQATGDYFNDMDDPKVAVRIGEAGDVGTMEIVEMLFTVNGPTAGAIMVEWNIKASSPGAAGLWDSHIRVGGGIGTGLDMATCPKLSFNSNCITASMLLHITRDASGYFENMWAWTADHDNDYSLYWEVDSLVSQISLYSARGILIESQDPVWIYGSGSEHTIMYQYETYKAKNVYLGHIQTESPYFQPEPVAPMPFNSSQAHFNGDPDFSDCEEDGCKEAWGLRILDSEGITVHSAGLYSWFDNYVQQPCLKAESCQSRIMEVKGSKSVAIYNIFTKGVVELATCEDYNISSKEAQQGFTTEISVWFPKDGTPEDDYPVVYLDPTVYSGVPAQCTPPCRLVFPPSSLPEPTTISIPKYTTSLQLEPGTTTTITVTVSQITVTTMSYSNVVVSSSQSSKTITPYDSVDIPDVTTTIGDQTRTLHLPPWPRITLGPPDQWTLTGNSTTNPGWTFPTAPASPTPVSIPPITKPDYTGPEPDPNAPTRWPTDLDPTPVPTPVPDEGEDDDDDPDDNHWKSSCKLWFFFICISWPGPFDVEINGWEWNFPPGRWGPGPPPPIPWPPGFTVKGTLPPWPEIT